MREQYPDLENAAKTLREQIIQDLYAEGKHTGHNDESDILLGRMYILRFGRDRYEFLRKMWGGSGPSADEIVEDQRIMQREQEAAILAERQNGSA